ncbi:MULTISPECIES: hypothetical protein [Actinomadura]|uniref:Guanylate cyclase domain-containing protein n=1 Tax=Actinomadura yumaensis TaxID=111807 RepID=A0ABW2CUQ9_9ACTN|nr:hypothetical protein [Actinomadura sp. J1-007]
MSDGHLVYRVLVAVDIQAYSKLDTREQLNAQRDLTDALDRAARLAGLEPNRWQRQVGGDGELSLLPEDIDPSVVVGGFTARLSDELRRINARTPGRPRLRLRVALHHGTLTAGPFGPAGDAPIVVQRLLDATPLRRLLTDDPGRDLALIVSDSLYEDVVRTGFTSLPQDAFAPIKVTAKGTAFRGYILIGNGPGRGSAQPPRPGQPLLGTGPRVPSFLERSFLEQSERGQT